MPERTYSRHSVFGMFSFVPDFSFQKANPNSLFLISLITFLCQLPLQTQYTKIILSLQLNTADLLTYPLIWIHVLLHPCRKNQYLHFFLLHTAISILLLSPRQSKSHYLPPWFISPPYTLLNPTLVSPDPFQTSYNFQVSHSPLKRAILEKLHNWKGSDSVLLLHFLPVWGVTTSIIDVSAALTKHCLPDKLLQLLALSRSF